MVAAEPPHPYEGRDPVWDSGFRSGWFGEPIEANPYTTRADRDAWCDGWWAGKGTQATWPKDAPVC